MEKIFENFTISVLKLNKLVQRIKQFEMREYKLKSVHVMCVYYLNEHREGLTASELMRLTYEDKAAISRALRQLLDNGYVKYDVKKYNSVITLTDDGVRIADYVSCKADKAVKAGSADFSEEERAFFYKSLAQITGNLKEYYEELIKNND
ncbi:MAG: MarR family winged helix-turn-helix transcriptional regulator [Clostridia bacterium]|nr:MarR family winged helix-turn-helix transcriptional regulator [Clostridia bacterium]